MGTLYYYIWPLVFTFIPKQKLWKLLPKNYMQLKLFFIEKVSFPNTRIFNLIWFNSSRITRKNSIEPRNVGISNEHLEKNCLWSSHSTKSIFKKCWRKILFLTYLSNNILLYVYFSSFCCNNYFIEIMWPTYPFLISCTYALLEQIPLHSQWQQ